ncbi:MAG: hypothetical protein ABIQ12_11690 [Opitutaceae bacterium]
MKSPRSFLTALVAVVLTAVTAFAADASPAGTWKFTTAGRGGNPGIERTLTLEWKDGKLSGTLKGASMGQYEIPDTAISAASFKDGTVAFNVELEFNGNKFVTKYSGKIEGDTLKGSVERPGRDGGAPVKTDLVAHRAK